MPRRVCSFALVVAALISAVGANAAPAGALGPATVGTVSPQLACGPNPGGDRTISRDTVMRRGLSWVTKAVPYSQTACFVDSNGSYRRDCSGFVSMAWRLGSSWTTSTLELISTRIPFDDLQPGDALNKAGTHVVLFAGWSQTDAGRHRYFDYYAQTRTGSTAKAVTNLDLEVYKANGYVALRYDKIADSLGDFDSDGNADLLAHRVGDPIQLHRGDGTGKFPDDATVKANTADVDRVLAPADFDGDHLVDVLARTTDGKLWIYPGTDRAELGTRKLVSEGWGEFDRILTAGDLDGDGNADVVARSTAGPLWRFSGTGTGSFAAKVRIGRGWSVFDKIAAPGDVDRDGRPDLVARTPGGRLWVYHGVPGGGLGRKTEVPGRWRRYDKLVAPGDFDGDGNVDLIGRLPNGVLELRTGADPDTFDPPVLVPGDWSDYESIV